MKGIIPDVQPAGRGASVGGCLPSRHGERQCFARTGLVAGRRWSYVNQRAGHPVNLFTRPGIDVVILTYQRDKK